MESDRNTMILNRLCPLLGQPLLIVTEFMENGSLDRYLKVN